MFDEERFKTARETGGYHRTRLHMGGVPAFIIEEAEDKTPKRIALALAILAHVALFVVTFPELTAEPRRVGPQQAHYVVRQVQFRQPPPQRQVEVPKPKPKRKVIPVPDPTPEEPEPIVVEELTVPDVNLEGEEFSSLTAIPDGPPGFGPPGTMRIGGEVLPPQKIYFPPPNYTEEARLARIQGVVILEAIIDTAGDVANVRILKGLPMGLDRSAVDTVRTWKFRPATMRGEPVPVYFNLTVSFSLQ